MDTAKQESAPVGDESDPDDEEESDLPTPGGLRALV